MRRPGRSEVGQSSAAELGELGPNSAKFSKYCEPLVDSQAAAVSSFLHGKASRALADNLCIEESHTQLVIEGAAVSGGWSVFTKPSLVYVQRAWRFDLPFGTWCRTLCKGFRIFVPHDLDR